MQSPDPVVFLHPPQSTLAEFPPSTQLAVPFSVLEVHSPLFVPVVMWYDPSGQSRVIPASSGSKGVVLKPNSIFTLPSLRTDGAMLCPAFRRTTIPRALAAALCGIKESGVPPPADVSAATDSAVDCNTAPHPKAIPNVAMARSRRQGVFEEDVECCCLFICMVAEG